MSTLCPAPWEHHCINTNGKNRLCCNSKTSSTRFNDEFDDYWTNEVAAVRQAMLENQQPPECNSCWKKEAAGIKSLRQQFIENYKIRSDWDRFKKEVDIVGFPQELDLKLGNYCNLSCRMCSSFSSSSYAKEFKTIYKETGYDFGIDEHEKTYVQNKWYNDTKFVDKVKTMIDNGLRQLKFTGGEPLMVPSVKTLIDYCIESGNAKNIDIVLITNGTLITQDWIDMLSKFKHVSFIFSVDGVGDVFEYIRHPAKWSQAISVFELLQNTNFYKSIAFTLQVYNVLDIKNILETSRVYNFNIDLIALDTPLYLDVINIPNDLKTHALQLLDINPANNNEYEFLNSCANKISTATYNKDASSELIKISKIKDRYKQQNIEKLEIWKYYE